MNDDICQWPDGPQACAEDPHGCFPCKLRRWRTDGGMQLSPAATPTKRRSFGPLGPKNNNSWERPVVTDDRGMPFIDGNDYHLIRTKEYAERRTEIEAKRRSLAQATPTSP